MRLFYISNLIFISFLLKSQQISNSQIQDISLKIEQLTSQVSALQAKITDLDTKGVTLQTSFDAANTHLDKIVKRIDLVLTGIKSLNDRNKEKIKDEKAPGFLIQDVISLYEEYTKKMGLIKRQIDQIRNQSGKNDPIMINLGEVIELVDDYNKESKKGRFWDLIKEEVQKLKSSNQPNDLPISMVANLQKILLRRIGSMNYEAAISAISNQQLR